MGPIVRLDAILLKSHARETFRKWPDREIGYVGRRKSARFARFYENVRLRSQNDYGAVLG